MYAPLVADGEAARVAALRACGLLDTGPDPSFDAFVKVAASVCETPIAVVNLVDETRQFYKARIGFGPSTAPRNEGFCGLGIEDRVFLEVVDATLDPRFAENPVVAGLPYLRFYAGAPLVDDEGFVLGTLCVSDYRPRTLTRTQRESLERLADSLASLIVARKGVSREDLDRMTMLGQSLEFAAAPTVLVAVASATNAPIITSVNAAFTELFAYDATDLIGKSLFVLCGERTDRAAVDRLCAAATSGGTGSEQLTLYASNGAARIMRFQERSISASHRIVNLVDLTDMQAAHDELERSNDRLRSLLDNNSDAVFTVDTLGRCLDVNVAAVRAFGHDRATLLADARRALDVNGFFFDRDVFPRDFREGRTMEFGGFFRHADGRLLAVECRAIPLTVRGTTVGAYVLVRDVTASSELARRVAEQAKRTHALYLIAANNVATDEMRIDAAIELVREALRMQHGFLSRIEGDSLRVLDVVGGGIEVGAFVPIRATGFREAMARNDVFAVGDLTTPESRPDDVSPGEGWSAYVAAPLTIGGRLWGSIGFVSTEPRRFTDFDLDFVRLVAVLVSSAIERGIQNERLDALAYLDALTGLPNRAKFMADMESTIASAALTGASFALHFVDLDGFKDVNDRAGHSVGDLALKEVARRLRAISDSCRLVARLGGDEFVIIQTDLDGRAGVEALARRVIADLSEPYALDGRTFVMGASVGVAFYPNDGVDASSLLRSADVALYRAKARGKGRVEVNRTDGEPGPLTVQDAS